MKMKKLTPRQDRVLTVVMWVVLALAALPLLHYGRMALVCDSFVVRGRSMEPTLHQGERVWVNKLIMGPRIYTCFDFSHDTLACFRLPGFRSPRVGDIAVAWESPATVCLSSGAVTATPGSPTSGFLRRTRPRSQLWTIPCCSLRAS